MRFIAAGRTDVGRRRPHNEDSYLTDDDLGLYIVCDGVGGNAKGEVASAESVELVPANPKYEPIVVAEESDFRILGTVRGVIRTIGR